MCLGHGFAAFSITNLAWSVFGISVEWLLIDTSHNRSAVLDSEFFRNNVAVVVHGDLGKPNSFDNAILCIEGAGGGRSGSGNDVSHF